MIECKMCGGEFAPKAANQLYCGEDCKKAWYKPSGGAKTYPPKNCKLCGKEFLPRQHNQVFCSSKGELSCQYKFHLQPRFQPDKRSCEGCGNEYLAKQPNQKYCSQDCGREKYRRLYEESRVSAWKPEERACTRCGNEFLATASNQVYCSEKCRRGLLPVERLCENCMTTFAATGVARYCSESCRIEGGKNKAVQTMKEKRASQPNFTNFNDLVFHNEHQFAEWFEHNYALFGLKRIIKIDRFFPDCLAEAYDGSELSIELEYHSSNFLKHNHDPNRCDLIVSFLKPASKDYLKGIPIIAIFDVWDCDFATRRLTPWVQDAVTLFNENLKKVIARRWTEVEARVA